jgi:transcriptional regulator with XRE-family HTH domain
LDQPIDVGQLKDLVRAHRARLGLSLRVAAEQADVPFNTLARVEKGHLPDLANFRRIVAWLGVDPERFFQPPRLRTESTPELIAQHLARDPNLSPVAAERIAGLVAELYDSLAHRDRTTRVHLRVAPAFTPDAARALAALLENIQAELTARYPN